MLQTIEDALSDALIDIVRQHITDTPFDYDVVYTIGNALYLPVIESFTNSDIAFEVVLMADEITRMDGRCFVFDKDGVELVCTYDELVENIMNEVDA